MMTPTLPSLILTASLSPFENLSVRSLIRGSSPIHPFFHHDDPNPPFMSSIRKRVCGYIPNREKKKGESQKEKRERKKKGYKKERHEKVKPQTKMSSAPKKEEVK